MTYYHGGKKNIGLDIAHVIYLITHSNGLNNYKGYCEPFCGMLGVYQYIPIQFQDDLKLMYLAGDKDENVISMWKAVQKGWRPPTKVTKQEYDKLRISPTKSPKKTFVGHACSYRGCFFSSQFNPKHNVHLQRDHVINIGNIMSKVKFKCGDYDQFSRIKKYIIYCDPPYKHTSHHFRVNGFNSDKFYDWCRYMSKNNIVFISEYSMPSDFIKVWSNGKECLFVI